MDKFFNQYSYVFLSLGLILGSIIVLLVLRQRRPVVIGVAAALAGVLVIGNFVVRPGSSDVNSVAAARTMLVNGKPTFVEFFSNYCLGCAAARPAVDQLVSRIQNQYNILRVDIHTDFGRDLREEYAFSYSPEFILFDTSGREVWRSHVPPSDEQLALAKVTH
jgi:thiol-disulfide isomerase/thioredoxin